MLNLQELFIYSRYQDFVRHIVFFPISGLSFDCSQHLLLIEILNFDVHSQICDTTERLHSHFSLSCIGEGNGNPTPVFLLGESQGRGSLLGCPSMGSHRVGHD